MKKRKNRTKRKGEETGVWVGNTFSKGGTWGRGKRKLIGTKGAIKIQKTLEKKGDRPMRTPGIGE